MKKTLLKFLILAFALTLSLGLFSACNVSHTHSYSTLKHNTEGHWYECLCGDKQDTENHKGGTATETQKAVCEVCGQEYGELFVPEHVHDYSLLKYDDNYHWYECLCQDKQNIEPHKGGTATETEKAVCEVCRQEYSETLEHVHFFAIKQPTEKYLKEKATCMKPAVYFYSCICEEAGENFFEYGENGDCEYGDWQPYYAGEHRKICIYNDSHQIYESCKLTTTNCCTLATCLDCRYSEYGEHTYDETKCIYCDEKKASIGLTYSPIYEQNFQFSAYEITGIGSCEDEHLIIPLTYKGKPVTTIYDLSYGKYKTIEFNNNITYIASGAFESSKLTEINIPKHIDYQVEGLFYNCVYLEKITIPKADGFVNYYGLDDSLFSKSRQLWQDPLEEDINEKHSLLKTIVITDNTNDIVSFSGWNYVTDISIYNNEDFSDELYIDFSGCSSLKNYIIPESVTTIDFSYCLGIEEFTIPKNVILLNDNAFDGCRNLKTLNIHKDVECIGACFPFCNSLVNINVEEGNPYYKVIDGSLYELDEYDNPQRLVFCAQGRNDQDYSSFMIPEGVSEVDGAFIGCVYLQEVVIPKTTDTYVISDVLYQFVYNEEEAQRYGYDCARHYFISIEKNLEECFPDIENLKEFVLGILYNEDLDIEILIQFYDCTIHCVAHNGSYSVDVF